MSDDVSGCASREAEARESLLLTYVPEEAEADAYRLAVRATLRAELRERIEGMPLPKSSREYFGGWDDCRYHVLALLDAGEPEGGA
jgi:hypothetical protein